MRGLGLAAAILLAACSSSPGPSASATSPAASTPTPAPTTCKLPVYWEAGTASGIEIRTAFVSVPDGTAIPVTPPAPLPGVFGAAFDVGSNTWLGVDHSQLSPDGSRYVYWTGSPSVSEVHLVDIATRADRTIYSGAQVFVPIAFAADAIYVVHAINLRQGAFEKLYRLGAAGGVPTLVPGSDRHMYQYGWALISDGAAWGIDVRVQGNDYYFSVLRLDLSTSQVDKWFEGPANDLVWPLGVDLTHRLYVQGVNQNNLWRLVAPGSSQPLSNPGPIGLADYLPGPTAMFSDAVGVWLPGRGGVWLYSDTGAPKQFPAGTPTDDVYPAGPCT